MDENPGSQSELVVSQSVWEVGRIHEHKFSVPMKRYLPARNYSDEAGEISSMYSISKASRALTMAILVLRSKKLLANCSPPSIMIRYTDDSGLQ